VIDRDLAYLDDVASILKSAKTGEEYKKKILNDYPTYGAALLIDIYVPYLYQK